jgi:DNA-directed RNA polymerase subunit RPC12/RpoP
MSEFKYACPVCGQHIKCDSSQAGTVMECPTCFQKITVPQAPEGQDQKFILTGSRVEDRRTPTLVETQAGRGRETARKFPVAAAGFLLVLAVAAGAGYHFYRGRIAQWLGHWQTADIGAVGAPGSFSRAGDTWNIAGSGADIWDQADSFFYVYRPASGDVSLTTRVLGLQKTDPWAKAGLMIRASLASDSAYAMVLVTPTSGVAFQQRSQAGSPASSVQIVPNVPAPCWLRLAREKDVFTAGFSTNGKAWTDMTSTTNSLPRDVYAGLGVSAHNYATLCQASFDQVAVKGGTPGGQAKAGAISTSAPMPSEDAPTLVAPPANDTNWLPALNGRAIPDSPVAGRIHGQDFIAERASFQDGSLVLRSGKGGAGFVLINLSGAPPGELSGKTINVTANADKAAKVTLHFKDVAGSVLEPSFESGYALRLQFGTLANDRLPGKIYLCLPDAEKSYFLGTFEAALPKPKSQ